MKIVVSKFGGSSMAGDVEMLRSASIVQTHKASIVVVSATYGTTDQLVNLASFAKQGQWEDCEKILFTLKEKHINICRNLSQNPEVGEELSLLLDQLETLTKGIFLLRECSPKAYDRVLSFGERMSSLLFSEALKITMPKTRVQNFDARTVIKTDSVFNKANPDILEIKSKVGELLDLSKTVYVTQGFIGSDKDGDTTTLGRGGSDYSASLLAEAVNAGLLQIWTDVAGIASTDPRICNNAKPIKEISYDEASEMAQYGAKILHPTTLVPAMRKNIAVFVGSSYEKDSPGTYIHKTVAYKPIIRAITKRQNQSLLEIRTPKMLHAIGFLSDIFDVFKKYQISVDCVTTSEISVAVTVDNSTLSNELFLDDLDKIGDVKIQRDFNLVSLIGNSLLERHGIAREIFNSIGDINIRMMCLGASEYNFNFLVRTEDADTAISNLHRHFLEDQNEDCATW
jgi:aspartate kinase